MLIDSRNQIFKAGLLNLSVGGAVLETQSKMRNLGVIFEASLTFDYFVQNTVN